MTEPIRRYKSFSYAVGTTWSHDRQGVLASDGKPSFDVASPPEFKGVAGIWTPEDLFVAAIDACQMTTFLALAARSGVSLLSYSSKATGLLEFAEGGYQFTKVTLEPAIGVAAGTDIETVRRLVENAHAACLIGRSVRTVIDVAPEITVE
jgi:organic hydroperoxide reductase OsmC/OhrA